MGSSDSEIKPPKEEVGQAMMPPEDDDKDDQSKDKDTKPIHADEETPTTTTNEENPLEPNKDTPLSQRVWEVFITFWPLGFIAFGGPQAHVVSCHNQM